MVTSFKLYTYIWMFLHLLSFTWLFKNPLELVGFPHIPSFSIEVDVGVKPPLNLLEFRRLAIAGENLKVNEIN